MNRQEAIEVLLRYRPGTADEREPEVAEALDLAGRDAALGRWLEEQKAFQEALRGKFRDIRVPEGLKEQILSERKVHLAPRRHRAAVLLTAAALVVCLLALALIQHNSHRQDNRFAKFRGRMAGLVLRQYPKMDKETNDPRLIHEFLALKGQGDYVLPERLATTTPTGCALLDWHDQPVSMICFSSGKTGNSAEPDLFLFIIKRTALADAPANSPQSAEPGRFSRLTTVSWSSGDKTYLLAGLGNANFIHEHL